MSRWCRGDIMMTTDLIQSSPLIRAQITLENIEAGLKLGDELDTFQKDWLQKSSNRKK